MLVLRNELCKAMSTKIAWTDETWNPVTGCSHVSEGCRNCYAEVLSLRFGWSKKPWTAQNAAENVVLHPERIDQPLHWRKPRRIFVNSMSDLFHEQIPDEFLHQVFARMSAARQHIFQVLTKRPERMQRFCAYGKPLPNVWLGVSCEDQATYAQRIPLLLETPAAVRFVSCEPLLGPIDLTWVGNEFDHLSKTKYPAALDWVIVGGESGPGFRPMNLDWARALVAQCHAASVPVFFKQAAGLRPEVPSGDPNLDGCKEFPRCSLSMPAGDGSDKP